MTAIGLISPFWLPIWGGAEQYHYRMAHAMQSMGLPLRILCGTAADPQRDNGSIAVDRHVPAGNFENVDWGDFRSDNALRLRREVAKHYDFINAAVAWCRTHRIRVALLGSPLQLAHMHHLRELYMRLKDMGIAVGLVHHDIPLGVGQSLADVYMREPGGWEHAADWVMSQARQLVDIGGPLYGALVIGTPTLFEPDFVISNSHWSARFVDPQQRVPGFVLHPLMDRDHWSSPPPAGTELRPADVLMVNPQTRKGPAVMKAVIASAPAGRTFRLVKGGWGEAFKSFRPEIAGLPAVAEGRVEFVEYLRDMRAAYRAAGVLLFPSLAEGYGMTPVEAMMSGTPVVSSNYPAIMEAVGDGALTLCPWRDGPVAWHDAVEQVLSDRETWRRKAMHRVAFLNDRQSDELRGFKDFLLARIG